MKGTCLCNHQDLKTSPYQNPLYPPVSCPLPIITLSFYPKGNSYHHWNKKKMNIRLGEEENYHYSEMA